LGGNDLTSFLLAAKSKAMAALAFKNHLLFPY
jgi:hypothetical protein